MSCNVGQVFVVGGDYFVGGQVGIGYGYIQCFEVVVDFVFVGGNVVGQVYYEVIYWLVFNVGWCSLGSC